MSRQLHIPLFARPIPNIHLYNNTEKKVHLHTVQPILKMTENDENADATTSAVVKSEEKGDVEESKIQEESPEATEKHIPHIRNDVHSPYVRWGVLLFLLATFILLVFADFGSGVTAESIVMENGEVYETTTILNVSVVSSVGKLWEAESYPLAIFIAITSIGWPYIKLALATVAWVAPYANPRRREFFIEVIDALGKWSFVDIMVLVEIMVAFRSSLALAPGLSLDIVIVAQWGFYGFVSCFLFLRMLSDGSNLFRFPSLFDA